MKLLRALAATALMLAVPQVANAQDWNREVSVTEHGFLLGNPQAPNRLTVFFAFSDPQSVRFEIQSEAIIRLLHIQQGKLSLELRPVLATATDMPANLLARCGGAEKFFSNYRVLIHNQSRWAEREERLGRSQKIRWTSGHLPQRMRAIAGDLSLDDLMQARGYSYVEVQNCLADYDMAATIEASNAAASDQIGHPRIPAFVFNGELLQGVDSWETLRPILDSALQ